MCQVRRAKYARVLHISLYARMKDHGANDEQAKGDNFLLVSVAIRLISFPFWFFLWIGFFWYLDFRTGIEKIVGFTTLILGAIGILCPARGLGKKLWLTVVGLFYVGGAVLLALL